MNTWNWRGAHVVVTGASSGIGEAIARELFAVGARLTLVARREDRLRALSAELGNAHIAVADLADPTQMTSWVADAEAALGAIDVLVNNAGAILVGPTEDLDPDEGTRLLRVNLHAPMQITRAVLPGMIARGHGAIVDVASVAALAPVRGYYWYSASKAALAAASESLRGEIRDTGVHVVTVYPGPVHSDMAASAALALEQTFWLRTAPHGTADKLARLVRLAVERRRARVIYPRIFMLSRWSTPIARWIADATAPRPLNKSPPRR